MKFKFFNFKSNNQIIKIISTRAQKENKELLAQTYERTEMIHNESDLKCSICSEYFLQPTTLLCGHTFCLSCLAQWYFASNRKRECSFCNQEWFHLPNFNASLKSYIDFKYPNEMRERERLLDTDVKTKIICFKHDLEANKKKALGNRPNNNSVEEFMGGFIAGLLIALLLISVLCFFLSFGNKTSSSTRLLKDIQSWSMEDTHDWLHGLGPWTHEKVLEGAKYLFLDGESLLKLNDTHLKQYPFEIDDEFYRHLLLNSVTALRKSQQERKWSIFDYKSIYSFKLIFSLVAFDGYPRLLLTKFYLFDSKAFRSYRNIIQYGLNSNSTNNSWLFSFYIENLLFPYFNVRRLISECFYDTNAFTVFWLTITFFIATFGDIIRKFFMIQAIM